MAGMAGNPFQTTQGNRLSCRDQEGRRGSEEAVPGPSVFPSSEPGVSGDFWGSQEGCQGPSRPSGRNRGLPLISLADVCCFLVAEVVGAVGPWGSALPAAELE